MKVWQVWDVVFPVCPWRGRAEKLVRQTYMKDPGRATVTRYKFGCWVEFADNPRCRFVHRGSGVVYYHTGAAPDRIATEAYFGRYPSTRKVWCLHFPHNNGESAALVRTINSLIFCPQVLPELIYNPKPSYFGVESATEEGILPYYLKGPWFYGSSSAMEWLQKKFSVEEIPCVVSRLSRHRARFARLFRLSSFHMSLKDAWNDNGRMWHGMASECLFEEAEWRRR